MSEQPAPDYMESFRRIRETANRVLGTINHQHDWDVIDTWRPENKQIHPRMQGNIPSTFVLVICKTCHIPSTIELEGIWTTEQVRGHASDQPSQDSQ